MNGRKGKKHFAQSSNVNQMQTVNCTKELRVRTFITGIKILTEMRGQPFLKENQQRIM